MDDPDRIHGTGRRSRSWQAFEHRASNQLLRVSESESSCIPGRLRSRSACITSPFFPLATSARSNAVAFCWSSPDLRCSFCDELVPIVALFRLAAPTIGQLTSLDSLQKGQPNPRAICSALLYGPVTVKVRLHFVQVTIFSISASDPRIS